MPPVPRLRLTGAPLAAGAYKTHWERLVGCRLTALGLEAGDAIYTLFVTTRIQNFLKGRPR